MKPEGAVLVALVAEPEKPLMAARARAELAAALGMVDYVVEDGGVAAGIETVELKDMEWTLEFMDRVRWRNGGGGN